MRSRISLFILIGLFLFIIDYRFSYDEDLNQIIIPDDEILGLIDTWRDQVGRDPSDEEIVRIINNLVNEEILYREALKLELDKNDRIIKRRLAQKVEFLKQDDTQPSTADLEKFYDENKSKYVVIGFGITEKTIQSLKKADGLVVGSAICKEISKSIKKRQNTVTNVTNIVKRLKNKIL